MSNDSKYKTLAKDTGLFAISNFGSKILIFLLTPLYTALLTTTEYGIADIISTTISFIYPILTLAISDAALRFGMDKNCNKKSVFDISIVFIIFSSLILLLFQPLFGLIDNSLNKYWLIFVINYILFNIQDFFANFIKAIGKTKIFAIQGILHTCVVIVSNLILLLWLRQGIKGYLISTLIGYTIPIFYMFFFGKLYNYILPFEINTKVLKKMLIYSIPMIPTLLAWAINTNIDKYMIIAMYGMDSSGIYSVAHKIPTIITTVIAVFTQAWQLSVISNYGSDDQDKFFSKVYQGLDYISIIICLGIIIVNKWVSSFLFAKDYFVAWTYVPMLLISSLFSCHSGFLAAAFRAAKKTKTLFVSVLLGSIFNIILNYLLLKTIGVVGAAIATAISFFIVWLVRMILIRSIVKIQINILRVFISYLLLVISSVLVMSDMIAGYYLAVISIVVITIINKDMLSTVIKIVKSSIENRFNKTKTSFNK